MFFFFMYSPNKQPLAWDVITQSRETYFPWEQMVLQRSLTAKQNKLRERNI